MDREIILNLQLKCFLSTLQNYNMKRLKHKYSAPYMTHARCLVT